MDDQDLLHGLRRLRRTVDVLQTEIRNGHMDKQLIDEIDQQMERGISTDARCVALSTAVDVLRENSRSKGSKRFSDTLRATDKLKDGIEGVVGRLG
jgi:hypothetical protein